MMVTAVGSGGCSKEVAEYPASQVFEFKNPLAITAQSLAFSPDGRLLAVGLAGTLGCGKPEAEKRIEDAESERYYIGTGPCPPDVNGAVFVLNLASGKKTVAGMTLPEWVNSLAFTPDGKTLVAGIGSLGFDVTSSAGGHPSTISPSAGMVVFWNTKSWKRTGELRLPGAVLWVAISPNGELLATMSARPSSHNGTEVIVWNLSGRKKVTTFRLEGYPLTSAAIGPVRPLAFSSDSKFVAAMDTEWPRLMTSDRPYRHGEIVRDDPARVVVWNVETKAKAKSFVAGWSLGTSVTFSDDGRHLTVAVGGGMSVWDTKTWERERVDVCLGALGPLYDDLPFYFESSCDWNKGRRCGIVWGHTRSSHGNKHDDNELAALLISPARRTEGGRGEMRVIAMSADRKRVAVAGTGCEVGVWKMPDSSELRKLLPKKN
jgi:WD40 repeat protein